MRKVCADTLTYMYNGHADVTALLESNGNLVATYYYDAFGNVLEKTGTAENSILYGDYQYDEETGLYYLNARMYDPVTARFLQQDTYKGQYSDPLSLNLYTYCHNDPLKYLDPTGHRVLKVGSEGNDVRELQKKLGIKADGKYGPQTAAAVKAYQKANGLKVDGIAGNQTKGSLSLPIDNPPSAAQKAPEENAKANEAKIAAATNVPDYYNYVEKAKSDYQASLAGKDKSSQGSSSGGGGDDNVDSPKSGYGYSSIIQETTLRKETYPSWSPAYYEEGEFQTTTLASSGDASQPFLSYYEHVINDPSESASGLIYNIDNYYHDMSYSSLNIKIEDGRKNGNTTRSLSGTMGLGKFGIEYNRTVELDDITSVTYYNKVEIKTWLIVVLAAATIFGFNVDVQSSVSVPQLA